MASFSTLRILDMLRMKLASATSSREDVSRDMMLESLGCLAGVAPGASFTGGLSTSEPVAVRDRRRSTSVAREIVRGARGDGRLLLECGSTLGEDGMEMLAQLCCSCVSEVGAAARPTVESVGFFLGLARLQRADAVSFALCSMMDPGADVSQAGLRRERLARTQREGKGERQLMLSAIIST